LTKCAKRPGLRQPSGALFGVTALDRDLKAAQAAAYAAVEKSISMARIFAATSRRRRSRSFE
jgi:hypothetical protein